MFRPRMFLSLLKCSRNYYTVGSAPVMKEQNTTAKQLYCKIKATGPITVADYMKDVLTNPASGYYIHKEAIGSEGDFITSPELNQMFGEMIAVWCLNEWTKIGAPKPFQIVELGPGRGSLSEDILRVFQHFQILREGSLCLVEISSYLSDMQARRLCSQSHNVLDNKVLFYKQGITHQGIPAKWYRHFDDIPDVFTILVAHEFFDALPVHKFQKTERGFREILIDIRPEEDNSFRYVLAKEETPASALFIEPNEVRDHVEISPESIALAHKISEKITSYGGLALIADYGHNGEGTDTFRAFKKHKLHDPLIEPGSADLTADVDFKRLKDAATESGNVLAFGPITQRDFLWNMGIEHRFNVLKQCAKSEKETEALQFGYDMMLHEDKMGKRFKFMSLVPQVIKKIIDKYPIVGFN